jgi:hypothetical protein
MQALPNQESLLQNQVFLATQYRSTYLRFPYPQGGRDAGPGPREARLVAPRQHPTLATAERSEPKGPLRRSYGRCGDSRVLHDGHALRSSVECVEKSTDNRSA